MNYEKAYKEALERAKGIYKDTWNSYILEVFPELQESEDEKISREITEFILTHRIDEPNDIENTNSWLAWLEKQGEQKSTQGIEPFEAEHGKYYYCIKDYFCGGKKQASKGDVVQALRGLPIMGLNDASEYFLPINFIKCNSVCGEEDERIRKTIIRFFKDQYSNEIEMYDGSVTVGKAIAWLEKQGQKPTLRERYENIAQSEWFKRTHEGMSVSDDEESTWTEED